jgi:hypothetical protein
VIFSDPLSRFQIGTDLAASIGWEAVVSIAIVSAHESTDSVVSPIGEPARLHQVEPVETRGSSG